MDDRGSNVGPPEDDAPEPAREPTGEPVAESAQGADDASLEDQVAELARALEREQALKAQALEDARREADRVRAARAELRATRVELARTQQRLTRVRGHPVVRLGAVVLTRTNRVIGGSRRAARRWFGRRGRIARMWAERARQPSRAEIAAFADRVLAGLPAAAVTEGPLVSIVMLTRNGEAHLRRCLPVVAEVGYRNVELVVVDNASTDGTLRFLESFQPRFPVRIVRNAENASFSVGNNDALAECRGELILFLNNDIEPIGTDWLGHMVETVRDPGVVAAGARLIHPRATGIALTDTGHPALSIQHAGIDFAISDGAPIARPTGVGEDPLSPWATAVRDVPALTAACLLVRRAAFEAVGGFTLGYHYGHEDVDLCLRFLEGGGRLRYDGRAALWHDESATRRASSREETHERNLANRNRFVSTWAPRLFRTVLEDAALGRGFWRREPLHVGLTVTKDDPQAGWGDWYTAHELGDALTDLGWRVSYLERVKGRWYEPDPSIDVIVALHDLFDVRQVPRGIVKVAWIRNWTERWLEHPWFDDFDIVLASSATSIQLVREGSAHDPVMFPIATNPNRFSQGAADPHFTCDVLFTGNHWGAARAVDAALPALARAGLDVRVYGKGWDDVPEMAPLYHGFLDYEWLPTAYRSARVVVDDTAGPTLPYGAVNSRVFDALASGALLVTDNELGSRELFGDLIPIWHDPDSLEDAVRRLFDGGRDASNVAAASRLVRAEHTYQRRAEQLRSLVLDWIRAPRVGIRIGIPDWEQAPTWGDLHFARALQRQVQRAGRPTRVHILPEWESWTAARDDLSVHLFGLSTRPLRAGQLNVMWHISHPDRATPELYEQYDAVFVASTPFAERVAEQVTVPVRPLHQATDEERFRPREGGPPHELLFVANSRASRRHILDDLGATERDLAVYGQRWTPELLDPRYLRGDHIPNERLAAYYAAAAIVLNDHWADMRDEGFFSNRLYDAAASGAFVISDSVPGLREEFDDGIVAYDDADELRRLVDWYLDHPEERRSKAEIARAAVLTRHTFRHRVQEILEAIAPLESGRRPTIH